MKYSSVIHSKLPEIGTSIFSIMSQLAKKYNAINLSQGFPDFNCNPELIALVNKYMQKGMNQYAPMEGILPLREAIAEKTFELYSNEYNPETEITITSGATQAIYTAISAFVEENNEVIIFTPAYDCYQPAIELNNGKPVFVSLLPPYFKINWNKLKKLINRRTKMIIINTPHNPTGTLLSAEDMIKLQNIIKNTDIIVLSDEVYEHIIFDNYEHQSIARFPTLAERSLIVSSFGKTYHTTGWKLGYCLAPANLMKEFRKVHQFIVYSSNTPIQFAYAEFLKEKTNYLNLPSFYQNKRDKFLSLIKNSKFTFIPSSGTYFQLLKYDKISKEYDLDFAKRLVKEFKIAAIPISVFYNEKVDNKYLRFCFAKKDETLEKAAEILNSL